MVTAEKVSARASVLQWITDGVGGGMTVAEAAEDALNVIKKEGKWDEFAREFITAGRVADDWRVINHNARTSVSTGQRKVDVSQLTGSQSILESLYPVGGTYKRLGDCTYEDCLGLQREYTKRVIENGQKARFFELVSSKLEGGQTVKDVLAEEQVREFYEQAHE